MATELSDRAVAIASGRGGGQISPLNFGPEVQYFDKELIFLSFLSFKMRKGFFRKMSKVISTVIPRSALDEAFVLHKNEVCASCRMVQTGGSPLRLTLVRLCDLSDR